MKKVLCAIIIVALIISGFVIYRNQQNKKAVTVAEEYLSEKYTANMIYSHVRYSWIDPSLYRVTFYPENNRDLNFEVYVQPDFTILEGETDNGTYHSADNYYLNYFEQTFEKNFQPIVSRYWKNSSLHCTNITSGLYAFPFPKELNDSLSLPEMEVLVKDYFISVNTRTALDLQNVNCEAEKVYNFLQQIREVYSPQYIRFNYNSVEIRLELENTGYNLTTQDIEQLMLTLVEDN